MREKWKWWQWLTCFLGVFCIGYWVFLQILYGNISFSIMFLLGGLCLVCLCVIPWYFKLSLWNICPRKLRVFLTACVLGGLAIFFGVECRILYDGYVASDEYGDTILVLGAGLVNGDQISASLRYRLDKAIDVHQKTPDTKIVVSGGQGSDETISEAAAMKDYLVAHGVPEERILMEDTSTNTNENFMFSKDVMAANGIDSTHITLITNRFHMHRASYLGRLAGFQIERAPAQGLWTLELCSYVREFFGVVRAYVLHY